MEKTFDEIMREFRVGIGQITQEAVSMAVAKEKDALVQQIQDFKDASAQSFENAAKYFSGLQLDLEVYGKGLAQKIAGVVYDKFRSESVAAINEHIGRLGVSALRARVAGLPEYIEEKRKVIDEKRSILKTMRQGLGDAELAVKEAEASLISLIACDPDLKNEKARSAELMKQKKNDPDYLEAAETLRSVKSDIEIAENEIAELETEAKRAEYEFTAVVAQLKSVSAELSIYAAALGAAGEIRFKEVM